MWALLIQGRLLRAWFGKERKIWTHILDSHYLKELSEIVTSKRMANSFAFVTLLIKETKSKSCVSFKLDMTEQCEGIESFIVNFEFTTKFAKLTRRGVAFLCALLKDGNSQSRPFYRQFFIGRRVAVVNENVCCLRCVIYTWQRTWQYEANPVFWSVTRAGKTTNLSRSGLPVLDPAQE